MANGKRPDFAAAYGDSELNCRFPNHWWALKSVVPETYDRKRVTVLQFECPNCHLPRIMVLDAQGNIVGKPRILYSSNPAYLVKGKGRIDRAVWRREVVTRALEQ